MEEQYKSSDIFFNILYENIFMFAYAIIKFSLDFVK